MLFLSVLVVLLFLLPCESKNPLWGFLTFFPKRLGIFGPNFTHLLHIPTYARLQMFIQLSAILTKLCHIKRNHPVHIICWECPPSAETHAGIFWHFPKQLGIFGPNFTHILHVGLKIPNRFGKNVRKNRGGGGFLTHTVFIVVFGLFFLIIFSCCHYFCCFCFFLISTNGGITTTIKHVIKLTTKLRT